jgi:hypothetical protein
MRAGTPMSVVDCGYTSAELLVDSMRQHQITVTGPLNADSSAQTKAGAGFDRAAFRIDRDHQQVICPQR